MTLTAQCSDTVSGVLSIRQITFEDSNAVATQTYTFVQFYDFDLQTNLVNGTINNGTFQVILVWPFYQETSTWTIQTVSIYDAAGNTVAYNSAEFTTNGWGKSVQVQGLAGPNTAPPTVLSLVLSPLTLDLNTAQAITLTITFAGNQTQGMQGSVFFATNYPGFAPELDIDGSEVGSRSWDASTSTLTRSYLIAPASMPPGTLVLASARFKDIYGNLIFYSNEQMASAHAAATVTIATSICLILVALLVSL